MCRQGMGRRSKPVTQRHNDSAHRKVGLGGLGAGWVGSGFGPVAAQFCGFTGLGSLIEAAAIGVVDSGALVHALMIGVG